MPGAPCAGNPKKINLETLNRFVMTLATSPYAELRNFDWAIELASKACEITSYHDPRMITALAIAQAAHGDYEAAIKSLDKSVDQQQGNVMDQYHCAWSGCGEAI